MYFRLGEFLIGIITGYIMFYEEVTNKLEKKLKHNKILLTLFWLSSLGFLWFHIFKIPFMNISYAHRIIYATFERELFACSICWIIFACHRLKSGGFIRCFLSHPAWQPLSKLSLSMYLLHLPYLYYTMEYYSSHYGFLWLMHIHTGDIVFSTLAATIAYVLIEAPIAQIVEMMCKKKMLPKNLGKIYESEKKPLFIKHKFEESKLLVHSFLTKK